MTTCSLRNRPQFVDVALFLQDAVFHVQHCHSFLLIENKTVIYYCIIFLYFVIIYVIFLMAPYLFLLYC
jgi:hypothetical protein